MSMRVAIVGGNGRVGRLVVDKLKAGGDEPVAVVRKAEQEAYFKEREVETLFTDITTLSHREVADLFEGMDAVVFCAGASGSGYDKTLEIDLDGNMKVVEACELAGIQRLIVISAIKADDRDFWSQLQGLRHYYMAKRAADVFTRNSKLDYTILQPGMLRDEPGTGKLSAIKKIEEVAKDHYAINREDVASFMVACLKHPAETSRKTIPLANGDVSIEEFISSL